MVVVVGGGGGDDRNGSIEFNLLAITKARFYKAPDSMKRERNSLEGRLNDTCPEGLDDKVSCFSFISIPRPLLMCPARYQVDPRY